MVTVKPKGRVLLSSVLICLGGEVAIKERTVLLLSFFKALGRKKDNILFTQTMEVS
jgi:hypothetical protein